MNRTATIRIESGTGSALASGARGFARAWRTGKDQGSDFTFESPAALYRSLTGDEGQQGQRAGAIFPDPHRIRSPAEAGRVIGKQVEAGVTMQIVHNVVDLQG
jgi:hypothetical protein